ncbi:MAG: YggS family pyridoxal phosphate-dependent enzyme [Muribaculaceae bacterium]|nr:YggS family pyridoxal phosphate-dependent enzyme [Muribaculaceae bacterium]
MSTIATRLNEIRSTLPEGVSLVAVSKFHPVEALLEAYDAGQRIFGESRVQELVAKKPLMPDDVRWHFIGHLQTNKVKALIGIPDLIESVDSRRLLDIIDRLSAEAGIITRVLLQAHVAAEETKFGFSLDELLDYFSAHTYRQLKATHLCGIMGMATNTDDMARVGQDFDTLASLFKRVKDMCPDLVGFDTLSMGMSDDYPLAIERGATLVRVGTKIFGQREY